MAGRQDLAPGLLGRRGQHIVDLTLAQDFQVCIGFVEQQNRTAVGCHEGKE